MFKLLSVSFEQNKVMDFDMRNGKFFIKFRFNYTSQMHTISSKEQDN